MTYKHGGHTSYFPSVRSSGTFNLFQGTVKILKELKNRQCNKLFCISELIGSSGVPLWPNLRWLGPNGQSWARLSRYEWKTLGGLPEKLGLPDANNQVSMSFAVTCRFHSQFLWILQSMYAILSGSTSNPWHFTDGTGMGNQHIFRVYQGISYVVLIGHFIMLIEFVAYLQYMLGK